jgi:hypothetical protein
LFARGIVESPPYTDIEHITLIAYPTLPPQLVKSVVKTLKNARNGLVGLSSHSRRDIANGFNLRNALRCCDLLEGLGSKEFHADVDLAIDDVAQFGIRLDTYVDAIVLQHLETEEERSAVVAAFSTISGASHF